MSQSKNKEEVMIEKRKAYCIVLTDIQAYILAGNNDGMVSALDWNAGQFNIPQERIQYYARMFGLDPIKERESFNIEGKQKTFIKNEPLIIEREMRDLVDLCDVDELWVTVKSANLCEIEIIVHGKNDPERWKERYCYSGAFLAQWLDEDVVDSA